MDSNYLMNVSILFSDYPEEGFFTWLNMSNNDLLLK